MSLAHPRGTSNTNARGNAASRRARREYLVSFDGWGNGWSWAYCVFCGRELMQETVTVDRIIPGILGGTYAKGNIRPACLRCNSIEGSKLRDLLRDGLDFFSRTYPATPLRRPPLGRRLSGGQELAARWLLADGRMTKTRIALEVGCSPSTIGRLR